MQQSELPLKAGQHLRILRDPVEGNENGISISPFNVLDCVSCGSRILFDDGYIISSVVATAPDGGYRGNPEQRSASPRKRRQYPNEKLPLPAMTDKDRDDLIFACENEVEFIAASFIRKAEDILVIKRLLEERVAKIS